jgi:hypothetical protein
MRRFTTDSGRVPTMNTLANQRGMQESQEYGPSVSWTSTLLSPFGYNYYCPEQPVITCISFRSS